MTDPAREAVIAVHNRQKTEVLDTDYEKVRCALLVYATQMFIARRPDLNDRARNEVERLDKAFNYDPKWRGEKGRGE